MTQLNMGDSVSIGIVRANTNHSYLLIIGLVVLVAYFIYKKYKERNKEVIYT